MQPENNLKSYKEKPCHHVPVIFLYFSVNHDRIEAGHYVASKSRFDFLIVLKIFFYSLI